MPGARGGGRWRDHRQVIDAIAWKYPTGSPWMDMPTEFGSWKIDAISIFDSEPERPASVDPAAVWRVPVGTVYVVDQAELDVVRLANETHAESPGVLGMEDCLPEPEPYPEPLATGLRITPVGHRAGQQCQNTARDRGGLPDWAS
ncbi:transposase [Streptomyces sioyaensis]|uniref:transposase n=1 Tax=Streptomyces sioyaensis TaxID=67364 RepID=UPI00378D85DF